MGRVLLLTNQLYRWAGSETIIVELAEEFANLGEDVVIFSNDLDLRFLRGGLGKNVRATSNAEEIRLADFDLIYCQHQVLTIFVDQLLELENAGSRPRVVYGHLSPFEPLEFPGPAIEDHFGDLAICNSQETLSKMLELGLKSEKLRLFPNPAPNSFFELSAPSGRLNRLLAVSNHFPKEVKKSLRKLERAGIRVTRRGDQYFSSRISADEMEKHDMVLTIGKTVQYALAARRPVYVYDHFGGPGWLSADNFDLAADFNFSGRCVGGRKSAEMIAGEILEGRPSALRSVSDLRKHCGRFRLEAYVREFFYPEQEANSTMKELGEVSEAKRAMFRREFHCYMDRIGRRNRKSRLSGLMRIKYRFGPGPLHWLKARFG